MVMEPIAILPCQCGMLLTENKFERLNLYSITDVDNVTESFNRLHMIHVFQVLFVQNHDEHCAKWLMIVQKFLSITI